MRSTILTAGQRGAYAKQLAANTADTVQFPEQTSVTVWTDGTAAVYVTCDGSVPTVAGAGTWEMPAGAAGSRTFPGVIAGSETGTLVGLISAGTPRYSVSQAQSA